MNTTNIETFAAFAAPMRNNQLVTAARVQAAACCLAQHLLCDLRLPPTTAKLVLVAAIGFDSVEQQ